MKMKKILFYSDYTLIIKLFLPVQIFLECILEGMMEAEGGLPVRCHGRQAEWYSWIFLCCNCIPKCNCWGGENTKMT